MSTIDMTQVMHRGTTVRGSGVRSASSVSAGARSVSAGARTRLRLTRRGRIVLTVLVALPILVVVGLVVLNGGQASAGDTQAHVRFQTVTIEPGETLWQVAQEQAPNSDPRDFVQDVVDLNALHTSVVQAGERIAIPTKYAHAR